VRGNGSGWGWQLNVQIQYRWIPCISAVIPVLKWATSELSRPSSHPQCVTNPNFSQIFSQIFSHNFFFLQIFFPRCSEVIGFPVSATGEQNCGGYCCATLERWEERGVLPVHAKEYLDVVAEHCPRLKAQCEAVKKLIDGQVKV
jgi:hypothetical protein